MITSTPLKQLPEAIKKEKFWKLYSKVPESKLRKRINEIIYSVRKNYKENEGKTFKEVVRTQTIERIELLEYCKTYGFPVGYQEED